MATACDRTCPERRRQLTPSAAKNSQAGMDGACRDGEAGRIRTPGRSTSRWQKRLRNGRSVSRPHANGGKRCRIGHAGTSLLFHEMRPLHRPVTLHHRPVHAAVARDPIYSRARPSDAPFLPQTLGRLTVSLGLGCRGVGFSLSVATYRGWIRREKATAKRTLHVMTGRGPPSPSRRKDRRPGAVLKRNCAGRVAKNALRGRKADRHSVNLLLDGR